MSPRTLLAILAALICGASATWGVYRVSRSRTVEVEAETSPILVAAVDIQRGRTISEEDVKSADVLAENVPEGAVTDLTAATGRVAMMEIVAGDALVEKKLLSEGAGRGLAALIPDGMRAYTIQTTAVGSTVAGLVMPGNHVDVLLHMKGSSDAGGGAVTRALMQSVEILAVGQIMQAPAEDHVPGDVRSVTLLVTPEQASVLDVASKIGTLCSVAEKPSRPGGCRHTPPALAADIQYRQELPLDASPTGEGKRERVWRVFRGSDGDFGKRRRSGCGIIGACQRATHVLGDCYLAWQQPRKDSYPRISEVASPGRCGKGIGLGYCKGLGRPPGNSGGRTIAVSVSFMDTVRVGRCERLSFPMIPRRPLLLRRFCPATELNHPPGIRFHSSWAHCG